MARSGNPENFQNHDSAVQRRRSLKSPFRQAPACSTPRAAESFREYSERGKPPPRKPLVSKHLNLLTDGVYTVADRVIETARSRARRVAVVVRDGGNVRIHRPHEMPDSDDAFLVGVYSPAITSAIVRGDLEERRRELLEPQEAEA